MPGSPADQIWIDAARRLDLPVARGGESYVHFDGRVLHIADDAALDDDDSLAQLILHEICHLLVEGPAARHRPDWTLDNTSDDDAVREQAAVRLQAHLLGAYGLRGRLYPTTVVRTFFESLGHDALGRVADGDPSVVLARRAAERAGRWPFDPTLSEALEETARVYGLARHPVSGAPLVADGDARSCGSCAFRARDGRCKRAPDAEAGAPANDRVAAAARACTRHEAALDCLECGACCRAAFDAVVLGAREAALAELVTELVIIGEGREQRRELRRVPDGIDLFDPELRVTRCAALVGEREGPYHCRVYDARPRTCRDFTRGGRHCVTARRRVGLSV